MNRKEFVKLGLALPLLNLYSKHVRGMEQMLPTVKDDFVWGVSTAAYQIEGGYNADGKTRIGKDYHSGHDSSGN